MWHMGIHAYSNVMAIVYDDYIIWFSGNIIYIS